MKRIIDGKKYNTDTADEIADWSNPYNPGDFQYVEETLYRTQKGTFFMVGEGGPASSYAEPCGNGQTGSSQLRPLTEDETYDWLERTGNYDVLETLFPDRIQEA